MMFSSIYAFYAWLPTQTHAYFMNLFIFIVVFCANSRFSPKTSIRSTVKGKFIEKRLRWAFQDIEGYRWQKEEHNEVFDANVINQCGERKTRNKQQKCIYDSIYIHQHPLSCYLNHSVSTFSFLIPHIHTDWTIWIWYSYIFCSYVVDAIAILDTTHLASQRAIIVFFFVNIRSLILLPAEIWIEQTIRNEWKREVDGKNKAKTNHQRYFRKSLAYSVDIVASPWLANKYHRMFVRTFLRVLVSFFYVLYLH